ncbi:uncharacterized protein [Amphiura filiformis]|uniref:uncharacterized protein n=1 Tax=Amphiura filiformis TaxID=82378 RepID=UPI003B20C353
MKVGLIMDGSTGTRLFALIIYLAFALHGIIHQVSAYNCGLDHSKFGGKQEGYLRGHVTDAYSYTRSLADCVALCGRHSTCSSVNYDLKTGNCELNDQTIASAQVDEFALTNAIQYMEVIPMWLQWGPWSACSTICGNGTEVRSRDCCGPGSNPACAGDNTESRYCNLRPCTPVSWGSWSTWSSCSNCGQSRSRVCEDVDATGDPCPGDNAESKPCNTASCDYRGCGGTRTDYAATFGLSSYSNNWSCTWSIQVAAGKRIELDFDYLNTESCCDRVRLNLGHSSPTFGGSTPSGTYISSSNTMTVTFTSDFSIYYSGFVLFYKTVD